MKYTAKLNLNKPDLTDYVSVEDLNENMDILDTAVGELKEGTAILPELETTDKTLAGGINEVKSGLTSHLADDASITKKGHVQLSSAVTSTEETKAATPKAVKTAMDRADAAFTSASNGKLVVGTAITGVDPAVVIPTEPTFNDLATAIGSISTGKKWASGNITNRTISGGQGILITGLGFIPKYIIVNEKPSATYVTLSVAVKHIDGSWNTMSSGSNSISIGRSVAERSTEPNSEQFYFHTSSSLTLTGANWIAFE